MTMTADELIKKLEDAGFKFVRQTGSHRIYANGANRVSVPYHKGDMKPGTVSQILRRAGMK